MIFDAIDAMPAHAFYMLVTCALVAIGLLTHAAGPQ